MTAPADLSRERKRARERACYDIHHEEQRAKRRAYIAAHRVVPQNLNMSLRGAF